MTRRKRTVLAITMSGLLAGVLAAAGTFWLLSAAMPETLIAAQLFRPADERSPYHWPFPYWVMDAHWTLAGERLVDRENHASIGIAKFMLGVEMRDERLQYPFDRSRFHELMLRYVCQAPKGIPNLEAVTRLRSRSELPEYIGALEACGRTRG